MLRFIPLALFVLMAVACEEEGGSVQFFNNTDSSITIFFDDQHTVPPTTILPGESAGVGTLASVWPFTITAEDPAGQVIFSEDITWDELERRDFEIVIVRTGP